MLRSEVMVILTALVLCVGTIWHTGRNVEEMKNEWQIIFWITASIVAWLTFFNARRGVLQPIRTEIFKGQVEALKQTQALFIGKQELELREDVALQNLIDTNAKKLLEDYCRVVLLCKYPCVPRMEVGDGWRPLNGSLAEAIRRRDWSSVPAEERHKFWREYKLLGLQIPRAHPDGLERIRHCLENPLLPMDVAKCLERYLSAVERCVESLVRTLEACAHDLPSRYPSEDDLSKVVDGQTALIWIVNCFAKRVGDENQHLRQHADAVRAKVREYLDVDNLLRG